MPTYEAIEKSIVIILTSKEKIKKAFYQKWKNGVSALV